ncbi:MAG TPA: TlpA disulfide reductase family protein [Blastocatellia bacterium]|nr:TlpA disulfide reductase family protein [Blastocatellia bacterium]
MNRIILSFLFSVLTAALFFQSASAQTANAPGRIEGQIVCCEDCWNKADRQKVPYGSAEDLAQSAKCISNGDPTLLAVTAQDGATKFYQLEDGKFKRPEPNWLNYVGSRVEITGAVRVVKKRNFVKVDDLKVLSKPSEPALPDVIGKEAELMLKDLFGAEQKLSSYRGRIVVLNFWATWCGPCKKEMPELAAIQNQYAAYGVQVIGASADTLNELQAVRQSIKETAINFPVWLGATTEHMAQFGLGPGLPGTAIIGRDGKIVAIYRSVITREEIKKHLDKLVAQGEREAKREQIAMARSKSQTVASSVPS